MSSVNLPNAFVRWIRDTSLMKDITKEYIMEVIKDGIARHGSQAAYEKAVGLNKQALKDLRRSKKCPPADIWQKIAREAKLEGYVEKPNTGGTLNKTLSANLGKYSGKKIIFSIDLV